jgi:peptidoglycan/LPS O-acetylase OafA/YrhL
MTSIGSRLDFYKGVGPGFNFVRIALALSIVAIHALTVTNQYWFPDDQRSWFAHDSIVPMFFGVSGFLVSASAYRLSPRDFLVSRFIRVFPGLVVDTFFCALILGPLFTQVGLKRYFTDPQFYRFFLNVLGWVHYYLPGVFVHFPNPRVNGSLWTVPFELMCYALLGSVLILGLFRYRFLMLGLVLAFVTASVLIQRLGPSHIHVPVLLKALQLAFVDYQSEAVTGFLFGILAYQFRYAIPCNRYVFAGCVLASVAMAFVFARHDAAMRFVWMPAIVYIILFIGLAPMPMPKFFKTGDYSYGIYLYHQPYLQVVLAIFPTVAFAPPFGAPFTFILALPFVMGMAWLSWHFVEKPALALRKRFAPSKPSLAQAGLIGPGS